MTEYEIIWAPDALSDLDGIYKLIYQVHEKQIVIIQVFATRQNPEKMKS